MARRPKRTRLYLNNQISRSQALAHLAQNEIIQQTVPGVEVVDYPQSEAEDVVPEHDEGCASEESSIEGTCLSEDLPAGDSKKGREVNTRFHPRPQEEIDKRNMLSRL
jgi:hypothetical protein